MTRNICKQFVRSAVALAVIIVASTPAAAQLRRSEAETAGEINTANKLLRDGKVDAALEAFRRVVPSDQQRDELNYNMAVAEYRKGNIDAAEKLFSEVAGTNAPAVSASSRYNLGNCQYSRAVQVAEQDKPAAIEHLRDAISHYRGALRGNANNPGARANIELAGELIRKLEQEQKQQDEQNKQDQEQQPQDDQKNADQQNQKDQSGQESDQQKKDGQEAEKLGDEQKKTDDQKSPGEESQADQPKPSEQQQQPQGSDNKQTQPQNGQQKSGDQQQPNDDATPEEQAAKNQPVPAGDLKAAGQQDENKKPDGTEAIAEPNAKDGLMTREEALKMLQSVRDRDMLYRSSLSPHSTDLRLFLLSLLPRTGGEGGRQAG